MANTPVFKKDFVDNERAVSVGTEWVESISEFNISSIRLYGC